MRPGARKSSPAHRDIFDDPPATGPALPRTIGEFQIEKLLGHGGAATVYLARHPRLDVRVALKVLRHSPFLPQSTLDRFVQEAQISARLVHPNIVRTYDIVHAGEAPCIVMEHVPGRSLGWWIHEGKLSLRRSLEVARDVARALQRAHECGVIHRDIKPSNILVDRAGVARILDFGVSRLKRTPLVETRTGELVGTPPYMAPEQITDAGDSMDGRTDLFALGVLLYEMITGRHPFRASTVFKTLQAVVSQNPPPVSRYVPRIPPAVDRLVMSALAKDPQDRPRSARDMVKFLDLAIEGLGLTVISPVPSARIPVAGSRWNHRLVLAALLSAAALLLPFTKRPARLDTLGPIPAPVGGLAAPGRSPSFLSPTTPAAVTVVAAGAISPLSVWFHPEPSWTGGVR